ncbi:GD19988 [Drosophila simulans]|uniref:GD19988 n=1 Tax=Drosophila simulans TaxID=7240 RepID=B4R115_DROSI|nr:GD19988 [Drosophila simulans]
MFRLSYLLDMLEKAFHIDFADSKKNGGKLLVINGFRFFRNKKRGHLQYWKCRNYYKERCPAIAIHDESTLILRLCHQHQHTESNDIEIKPLPGSETKLAESAEDEAQAEPEAEMDNEDDPDTAPEPAQFDYGHGQYRGNNPQIQFSVSKRGGQLLWLDGMKFFRNNINRTNLYWRCHWYYRHTKCPVLICMSKTNSNDFRQIHDHCHMRPKRKENPGTGGYPKIKTPVVSNVRIVLANEEVPNPEDVLVFFTQSLRGRPAIMANGIRFLIMSENKKKILWRCSSMATKKIKCPARITMLKETPPKFIINKAEHLHAELKRNKYSSSKAQTLRDPHQMATKLDCEMEGAGGVSFDLHEEELNELTHDV